MNNHCNSDSCNVSHCTPNRSIECSVKQCKNHCQSQDYCSLNSIRVSTHETNPTECKCTDCASFVKKQNG